MTLTERTGGTWTGAGTLEVDSTLTNPASVSGLGQFVVTGTVASTASLTLPVATILAGYGTLGSTGTVTVPAGATLSVEGCGTPATGAALVNDGTITFNSCGDLNLGGPLTNNGTINGSGTISSTLSPQPTLTNASGGVIAPTVTISVPIDNENGKPQTITFTSSPPTNAAVDGNYTVTALGGKSGNPVVFSTQSTGVCSINGADVSFTGQGTCVIDANQAGDLEHQPAPTATQSVNVGPANDQAITSANAATAIVRSSFDFDVTTSGSPAPKLKESGVLPKGITFVGGAGTATIQGTAKSRAVGTYVIIIKAKFGSGAGASIVTQAFTLTVTT